MNNDNVFAKLLAFIAIRVFLFAWLIDIMYDGFAPTEWQHFGYWTAVLGVLLFNIVVGALRKAN
jgi:hypothetical protein